LFNAPLDLSDEGKAIFSDIVSPLRIVSALLRSPALGEYEISDIAPYWRKLTLSMKPLMNIAHGVQRASPQTRECAYAVLKAVWPVCNTLDDSFSWWEAYQSEEWQRVLGTKGCRHDPRRLLEITRKRLVDLSEAIDEEKLLLALRRAITADAQAAGGGQSDKAKKARADSEEKSPGIEGNTDRKAEQQIKERMALAELLTVGPNASRIAREVGVSRTTLLGWKTFREHYDRAKDQQRKDTEDRRRRLLRGDDDEDDSDDDEE
jgi:hypothetical protein